jgi:LmbE family N-acetylglucosaminyl deacetylase
MQPPLDFAAYNIESLWLSPAPAARTVLVVYAHPDDESFGSAGTIVRYAAEGVAVHLACATCGESGTVLPKWLEGYADIAALRSAELECAARELGLAAVHFLGYRDSGMAGATENNHPNALTQAPVGKVAAQIVALIRALCPQVVLTFGPYGGYGHPDHIATYKAAREAFVTADESACFPEQIGHGLAAWQPAKFYYSTIETRLLRASVALMRLRGRDPRRVGDNHDIDMLRAVEEATATTTKLDNRSYLAQIERAWRCHASQLSGVEHALRLPLVLRRRMLGFERFTRVAPPWQGGRRERDLFEGIEIVGV